MAKYCSNCGYAMDENAVVCAKCGTAVQNATNTYPTTAAAPKVATVLGILGIVFAWLFALVGHVLSIIGIVIGIKEYRTANKTTGLILCIIGEACAILNSLLGALMASALFS